MDNNKKFRFDSNVSRIFFLAYRISLALDLDCISDVTFFIAMNLTDNTPLRNKILDSGISEDEITEFTSNILTKYYPRSYLQRVQFTFHYGNISYPISENLHFVFELAQDIALSYYNSKKINSSYLLAAFAEFFEMEELEILNDYLKKFNLYPVPNNKLLEKEDNLMKIPIQLSTFLTVLNDEFSPDEEYCKILGRDDELKQLIRILSKDTKRNAIFVGPPGVGKTAIVEKLTWLIVTGNCPAKFQNSKVVCLDVTSIIADTKFRGTAEARFTGLIQFLEENPNCILFIDEIHTILGAGACVEGELDLANSLKPILSRGKTQVIGATTEEEYAKYFSKDGALKRRFERINVKEPKVDEIYPMIQNQIRRLSNSHKVTISQDLVNFIIFYASCFNYETKNPDRTLDLIDKSMAIAELNGKTEVSKEDVLDNFNINISNFLDAPKNEKIGLAFHEAGHYIVHRFADQLSDYKILAISIIPAENYQGVNVFEIDTNKISAHNYNYFVQLIASKLAGRIAEQMFSKSLSSGASSDLKSATEIAQTAITEYGLDPRLSNMRIFTSYEKISNWEKAKIEKRVNKLLKKSWNYAKRVLKEHDRELNNLVNALLEKGMLSATEIEKIIPPREVKDSSSTS